MNKFTRNYYGLVAVISIFSFNISNAQCVVVSSNGYQVTMAVMPVSIIKPSSCPYGYNYNISFYYNISFTGNNIPANLYTLQGNIICNGQANFFSLPKNGGTGTRTSVSNPWRSITDCATATPASLQCNTVSIIIQGPGIPTQTIQCMSGGSLPVNLVSFNGRIVNENDVYLTWTTASETNNKTFTVERSMDAVNWEPVTIMTGAGTVTSTSVYAYTDAGLKAGMYFYRLKQTDFSGTVSFSNIIGAKITGKQIEIGLVYNGNQLQFSGLNNSAAWEMVLFNSASAFIMSAASIQSSTVQLPNLTAGIYFVRLRNKVDQTEKTFKFFKG